MTPPLANHANLPLNPALKLEYVETPSKKTAQKKAVLIRLPVTNIVALVYYHLLQI